MVSLYRLLTTARSLQRNQRGAVAMLFGLMLIPVIGMAGLAIDSARAYSVQQSLQISLDAAGLAGMKMTGQDSTTRDSVIQKVFQENWASQRMSATLLNSPPVTISDVDGSVTLTASAKVPMVFMGLFGINNSSVASNTTIVSSASSLELALVLDISGSMGDSGKIDDLRDSATELVETLIPTSGSGETYISIVPWSVYTYLDTTYSASWLTSTGGTVTGSRSLGLATASVPGCGMITRDGRQTREVWKGEVLMRSSPYHRQDDNPASAKFDPMLCEVTDYTLSGAIVCTVNDTCTDYNDTRTIVSLTSDTSVLKDRIDNMELEYYTDGAVGLFWGWMTISPNWRGYWTPSPITLPKDYDETANIKAVIFMTDGLNNNTEAYNNGLPDESAAAINFVNTESIALCTAMKAQGIRIFTVAFDIDSLSSSERSQVESTLTSCASSASDYFSAPDGSALAAAFSDIASNLSSLRISK